MSSELRNRNPPSSKESPVSPQWGGNEWDKGFDRVDARLKGKYAHIPLSEDEMEEYGPFPWMFTRMRPYGMLDWILVPFMFVFTWPLRLFFLIASFFLVIGATFVFTWPHHNIDNPVTGWKKRAQSFCVGLGTRCFFYACGYYWISTSGKPDVDSPTSPPIVVSNHVSWLDPAAFMYTYACPAFVARDVTKGIPMIGPLTETAGSLFVTRDEAAREGTNGMVLKKLMKFCKSWPLHERPLVMYPEGTATNGESLLEFKTGAFAPGAPVQPVLLRYCKDGPFVAMEHGPVWWIVFTLLLTTRHSLHIQFLPTYFPNEAEKADPALYAQNVRKLMAKELNVPMIDGMAVRERYLWFDHFYHRTTTREQYLSQRDNLRKTRNEGKEITLTWPDGRREVLES